MRWGVACVTARADVYAMMMGSLTDDQILHNPHYVDEATSAYLWKYLL